MQVYRGMDIGTAKPDAPTRARFDYRMIDLVEPEEPFTVGDYQARGRRELAALAAADRPVVLVGGSGLHFRSLVDPLRPRPRDPEVAAAVAATDPERLAAELLAADPDAGEYVDLANPRRVARAVEILRLTGETPSMRARSPEAAALAAYRPELPFVGVGIDPGARLADRVARRLERMLDAGLLDEVAGLAPRLGPTARQAVGYKELLGVVRGESTLVEGVAAAQRATVALARRQRTFFRRDPRIRWLTWQDDPEATATEVIEIVERAWTS